MRAGNRRAAFKLLSLGIGLVVLGFPVRSRGGCELLGVHGVRGTYYPYLSA